jgi:hypothetical protein
MDHSDRLPVEAGVFTRLFGGQTRRRFLTLLAGAAALLPDRLMAATKVIGPCGAPKPPKPAHASAAEGLPPLPLPAVPLRRTEKKHPPKPPSILAKIRTGELHDWATDPNDTNNLLNWMKSTLGVNFGYVEQGLDQIDLESHNVPVLYRTGHNAFSFTDKQRGRLHDYLLRGGMIIFDACCGRTEFAESARREIATILPEHELKQVSMDHPVFNCYYQNAGKVRFTKWSKLPGPSSGIEGVEIGCRMAVIFSPHDLSCGWDMHTHEIEGCTYIESDDALKIGANLIAYATATRDLSTSLADSKAYIDAEPTTTDKFQVGQIVHEGDWNPDPVGLRNLLDTVGQTTALKLSFASEPIRVESGQLSKFPFIYMTGHDDFKWSDAQASALRQYLSNGGFLFAEACCGRQGFDVAFRREIGKVLRSNANAGGKLAILPPTHEIFSAYHVIDKVGLLDAVAQRGKGGQVDRPRLEAAYSDGRIAVAYSPLGLNVGWRLKHVPYARGYTPKSALALGTNIVMHALSQ